MGISGGYRKRTRLCQTSKSYTRGRRSGISRQESLSVETLRGRRAFRAGGCLDDKHRKIAFKGPYSHHRKDKRWKIDLFRRAQNRRGRACPSELGPQKREKFLLSFSATMKALSGKSRWNGKRLDITAPLTRPPPLARSISIGSMTTWFLTLPPDFNRGASTDRRKSWTDVPFIGQTLDGSRPPCTIW